MAKPNNDQINNNGGEQQSLEIIQLSQSLDQALKDHQIEPDGLNPLRNGLYTDYFEQLLTLLDEYDECSDLVLLLSRFKDELTMTSASYKKLYESSVTFGIQKALTAQREKDDLKAKIQVLQEQEKSLQDQNEFLLRKIDVLEEKVQQCRYKTTSDAILRGSGTTRGTTDDNNHCMREARRGQKVDKYKLEIKRMKDRNEAIKHHVEEYLIQGHEEICNATYQNVSTTS